MKNNTKAKKITMILLVSILAITMFVGYTNVNNRILFPGGAYIRQNGSIMGVNYDNYYYEEDGQVYFTMYDEVQNITEYCSSETYFIDQVQIGDYRQTIIIGGEIGGDGLDALGSAFEFGYVGESVERDTPLTQADEVNGDVVARSEYRVSGWGYEDSDVPIWMHEDNVMPTWLQNATNDYNIKLNPFS